MITPISLVNATRIMGKLPRPASADAAIHPPDQVSNAGFID